MYEMGTGVSKDNIQAFKWFYIASANGNEEAKKKRGRDKDSLTPEQIAKANELAREWMEAHKK